MLFPLLLFSSTNVLPLISTVRLFFDVLHGIKRKDVTLVMALEFAILLGYDGQLKQNSSMEMELFTSAIKQLKKSKMSKLENALVWLYAKTWDLHGQHVLDQYGLWTFATEDLNEAIMGLAYPKHNDGDGRVQDLKDLIMGRFENGGLDEFRKWSGTVHGQVIENSEASDVEDLSAIEKVQKSLETVKNQLETKIAVLEEKLQSVSDSVIKNHSSFRATAVEGSGDGDTDRNMNLESGK